MCLGTDVVDALGSLQLLIVGAGALGCEDAKNLAGVGACRTSQGGHVLYFDDDIISLSTPTRQFCFTEKDALRQRRKADALVAFMTQRRPQFSIGSQHQR